MMQKKADIQRLRHKVFDGHIAGNQPLNPLQMLKYDPGLIVTYQGLVWEPGSQESENWQQDREHIGNPHPCGP